MRELVFKKIACVILIAVVIFGGVKTQATDSDSRNNSIYYAFEIVARTPSTVRVILRLSDQNYDCVELTVVLASDPSLILTDNPHTAFEINCGERYQFSLRITKEEQVHSFDGFICCTSNSAQFLEVSDVINTISPVSIPVAGCLTRSNVYESEPNNSYSYANLINDDDNVYGRLRIAPSSDSQDWYRVQFNQSGYINVFLGNIPSGCNYDLALYSSNGTTILKSSCTAGNANEVIRAYPVQAYTDYYLRVYSNSSQGSTSYYLLRTKWYDNALATLGWSYFFSDTTVCRITQRFGQLYNHHGIDVVNQFGATLGIPILSVASGEVKQVFLNTGSGGYGISIETSTTDPLGTEKLWTTYYHMLERPNASGVNWAVGNTLNVGAVLGQVGNTGTSTGPHLHFKVNNDGTNWNNFSNEYDPVDFFPQVSFTYSRSTDASVDNNVFNDDYIDHTRMIDIRLVDYVGEENCLNWIRDYQEDKDIIDFLLYFDISISEFRELCNEFEGLDSFYEMDWVLTNLEINGSSVLAGSDRNSIN